MAATLQAVLAISIIWFAHLRELLSYLGMTLSFSALLTVSTVFKLYKTDSVKSFVRLIAPMVFIVLTTGSVLLAGYHNPGEALASIGTLVLCVLLYSFFPVLSSAFRSQRVSETQKDS
jgi:hypothetical protein